MDQPKWKDTFHFTQSERRGVFILATILLLLLLVNSFFDRFYTPTKTDFTSFEKAIKEFEVEQKTTREAIIQPFLFNPNTISQGKLIQLGLDTFLAQRIINYRSKGGTFYKKEDLQKIYGLSIKDYERLAPFVKLPRPKRKIAATQPLSLAPYPFDPNTITKKDLLRIGVSAKATTQWINYRNKGGVFKKKEDVAKIYALTNSEFQQLADYLQIAPPKTLISKERISSVVLTSVPTTYESTNHLTIDVNRASAEEWQQLKGIGPYYSKRIISFRDKLGGFASVEQVRATYGLPDSLFLTIKSQLLHSPIRKPLHINRASVDTLKAHPYIQYKQAKAIVNYRKNHGSFGKWEDLLKVKVLSEQELERLKPYLDFRL